MNLACSCDYRSQSCKAYCQLLQPVGAGSCHHQIQRKSLRHKDPLRQLNSCCYLGCDRLPCAPDRRPSFKTEDHPSHKPSDREKVYNKMNYSFVSTNKRPSNSHHFQNEWHSTNLVKTPDEGFSRGPGVSGDTWNRQSMTFDEEERYSVALRKRFIEEMEELKAKLCFLRNGMAYDGKRLRQRSESEPGCTTTRRMYKRARDHSPLQKRAHRKLPCQPVPSTCSLDTFPIRPPFQRETRSVPPTLSRVRAEVVTAKYNEKDKELERFLDLEGSLCGEETPPTFEDSDSNVSEDHENSSRSVATSASTNSSTPTRVGESLGSINLSEGNVEGALALPQVPSASLSPRTPLFRPSLFSNVPPFVRFSSYEVKGPSLPCEISKHLKWKLSSITPIVIRKTLVNSGFRLVRKSNDWTGQWGKHMTSFVFKTLKDFQKLNHFPGTFQIGRKDRLWKNLSRLMIKFGKKEFGFLPTTYILPHDTKSLRTAWEKSSGKGQWILKPPAAARGTGIRVVHKWTDIPKNKALIVQKYIAQPYLINGSKFDLRLYVLMTSIHPLRIYLYDDGLVRFASVKYSENVESLGDRFMHLTNYSINKLSTNYCANEDASSCQGHKWTLKTLWTYLEKEGVDVNALQKSVNDLVIKTIISGESYIQVLTKNNLPSRYCSYELFGIDVLLDSNLRPWLLEVNISPSLHSASPLDLAVKGPLVRELFNIAGFHIPAKLSREQEQSYLEACGVTDKTHTLCFDKRIYTTSLSREERCKHASHNLLKREEYMNSILEDLTPDDVKHLIQFEDELTQISRFERVFPTPRTYTYHQYFDSPRYYNMMLDAWETRYSKNRAEGIALLESLCRQNIHLQVPFPGGRTKCSQSQNDPPAQMELVVRECNEEEELDIDREGRDIKSLTKSGKRKPGVLARPLLRAIAPRRTRNRATPDRIDRAVNTEPLVAILPQKPNFFQNCKLETNAPAPQLPPINIRTTS